MHNTFMKHQTLVRRTSAIILQYRNKVLLGLRYYTGKDEFTSWQFPQGGIEANESPLQAAQRELYEETMVNPFAITWSDSETDWYDINIPNTQNYVKLKFFHATIDILPTVTMCSKEFIGYQWLAVDSVLDILPKNFFKRKAYEASLKYYKLI